MLQLQHVEAGYGPARILHGVTLAVDESEVVCLLGSNGAGKTTTLLTIIGMLRANTGTVVFRGAPITGLKTSEIVRRGIAIVPEGRRIFGPLTIAENLRIGAAAHPDGKVVEDMLDDVLDLFPILRERFGQLGGTLSGGQQQMLAIARAMMAGPRLILMDEPSMGLSPVMCDEVFDIIGRIRARGVSVLLVEQNALASFSVATRGYVLQSGEIAIEGTTAELRESALVKEAYL